MRIIDVLKSELENKRKVAIVTDSSTKKIARAFIEQTYGVFNESTCQNFVEDYKNSLSFFIVHDYSPENLIKVFEHLYIQGVTSVIVDDTPKHLLRNGELFLYTESKSGKINVCFI